MARSRTRRAIATVAAIAPLLVACNSILGISDFTKAECAGGEACLDNGPDAFAPDGGGDAKTDGPIDLVEGGGSAPVSWARWVMPNYSQPGVVPDASVPTYSHVEGDAGAVSDSVSRLVWRPVTDAEKKSYSFRDASDLCANAKGGTWRLPTRIELVTLLDFSQPNAKAAPVFNLEKKQYWTTSFFRTTGPGVTSVQTPKRLVVGFDGAPTNVIGTADETDTKGAICISAQ